eukprot:gnl/TRDRNA2_/TRDRNA2_36663_c0_seq2.p1 gnl/TRDRNA2_/TRDRNA2_36663_c0~~gnl/TRDRNA2_/TRDRNA2_36663_c0_seq2.p1  ORF type:complete len:370 (-),score=63.32 gnl/TRDRNA2_/TRDRNA2_36663_c0_seq2:61-1170(-)
MVDEKTPLIRKGDVPKSLREPAYPEGRKYRVLDIFRPIGLALRWYWGILIFVIASALLNFALTIHHDFVLVLHPLVFKSLLVVFGFILGFRNVRANNRTEEATSRMQELFSAAWTILMLTPSESRPRLSRAMVLALNELAGQINAVRKRKYWWYAMMEMRPDEENHLGFTGDSGRTFLMHVLLMAEELLGKNEPSAQAKTQKLRILWPVRTKMLDTIDRIFHLCTPAVSDRYCALVDGCLFFFVVLLPWGLEATSMDLAAATGVPWMVVSAAAVSGFEAIFVAFVLLGLNALATENEDPFMGDYEDLHLDSFVRIFELKIAFYEDQRAKVAEATKGQTFQGASEAEVEVWYHAIMCGAADASEQKLDLV